MAEMCQLSKMLTQHKPLLSWCSLLPKTTGKKLVKLCFLLPTQTELEDVPDCMACSILHPLSSFLQRQYVVLRAFQSHVQTESSQRLTHVVTIWHNPQWETAAQYRLHTEQFPST